jgi:hypothetical protein
MAEKARPFRRGESGERSDTVVTTGLNIKADVPPQRQLHCCPGGTTMVGRVGIEPTTKGL